MADMSWRELILLDFVLMGWTAFLWLPLVLIAFAIGRRLQIGWRFVIIAIVTEIAAIAVQLILRCFQAI